MKQYTVDAFTDKVFGGNPAAVCVMDSWLPDETMQKIAIENNLSETAFTVKTGDNYHLRWFTPGGEIDLCGHATLATAYTLFRFYESDKNQIVFDTMSGQLIVNKMDDLLEMDFPAYDLKPVSVTAQMTEVIGTEPVAAFMGRDLLCVVEDETVVKNMSPDMEKVLQLDGALLHVTAPGADYDCVSRSFAPKLKINEDPVCGSGHCHIVPYWATLLKKADIFAYQASARGGQLYCTMMGDRVKIAGKAALYAESEIYIP
ncbi:MAG: PhzF family phenazine biosynthesis protein [Oscillospiraceae bacterium]|nr:PhzF family phenazine biosynthesis protein [Oscillospiraceae bacterium]